MQQTITQNKNFHWLDVIGPTKDELDEIALKYNLHPTSVQDCLDPVHLPKSEKINDLGFIILRAYDENCSEEGDSFRELTRKVAIFYSDTFVITIHRKDQSYITKLKQKWQGTEAPTKNMIQHLVSDLILGVLHSYEQPIQNAENLFEELEMGVFEAHGAKPFMIEDGYYLKRRAAIFKRMLSMTRDLLTKISTHLDFSPPHYQDIRERCERLYFYTDELLESMNSLLNMYVSLNTQKTNMASNRLNEVVRVLTILSVFLLPLNLITGIYGMNFAFMPELSWKWGYPLSLLTMLSVVIGVFLWFRSKGWLR
ncbi:MAG: hypothetical protein JNM93_04185 [Bacteriovoracaceae bacterium]|nr:hypothetical protein [Bacteriovoracaceae bacterium]